MANPKTETLTRTLRGSLIQKEGPAYTEACKLYNGMIDKRPLMIARIVPALLMATQVAAAQAAPPPDASGQFREWFRSLTVPGSPSISCCTVADCRMVESRWNDQKRHFEARVIRDVFGNALRNSALYEGDAVAYEKARYVWMWDWTARFGDKPETWIEIPDAKVNHVSNPTGQAVLCWSTFYPDFNGVFCFIPYQGS